MGGMLSGLTSGLANLTNPLGIVMLVVGTVGGALVGVIPGLGGLVPLVVILPFLYRMSPVPALALLVSAQSATYYAGSTTAILINTPGAPESAATAIDGYAMTQKGETVRALGISAAATTFGGWFGAIVMVIAIPLMMDLVHVFHPPEYFWLSVLAVVIIGRLQAGSVTKGLLSGAFGFMVSFVGAAASTGALRFTFGSLALYNGINIITVAIGVFAMSQMYLMFGERGIRHGMARFRLGWQEWSQVFQGVRDVLTHIPLVLRSAAIGVICGIVPGIGSTAANFISYGQAQQASKHPELFGTGTTEGIIAPEGSSISKEAGAMIPTVALGIPNGPAMAVILAAFSILGFEPGPTMLTQHLAIVFMMVWVLAVASLLGSVFGLALAPIMARITQVRGPILVGFVYVMAAIGVYATVHDQLQVAILAAMGVVGLAMRRYNYSLPAVIVGVVLGTVTENNLILTLQIYGWRFLERPLTDIIILTILIVVFSGFFRKRQARVAHAVEPPTVTVNPAVVTSVPSVSWIERIIDILWVLGSGIYVAIGAFYPPPSNIAPTVVGGAAFIVGVIQLVGAFVPSLRVATHGTGKRGRFSGMGVNMEAEYFHEEGESSYRYQIQAIILAFGFIAGCYLFGYQLVAPAFILTYFTLIYRQRWPMVIISTLFISLVVFAVNRFMGILLPTGVVWPLL